MPKVSLAVIRDESVIPQCKIDYLTVWQLSGDSNDPAGAGCDAMGVSLSSYSAEEIFKKQCDEPVFHCLINFLNSRYAPLESELILMGPEAECYFLERGQFIVDDKGVIWRTGSSKSDRLLVPGNLREEALALVHDIPSSGH